MTPRPPATRPDGRRSLWMALGLLSVVAAAAGLRLAVMADYLGYDECQHYLVAESPLWSDFQREFRIRTHPPLVYLAMKPFLALGHAAWAVKLVSLLSGLAAVPLCYAVLRPVLARPAALLAAGVITALPILVIQSVEVRQYSLGLAFVWLGLVTFVRMEAPGDERPAGHWRLAAAGLLTLLTEYQAAAPVLAVALVTTAPACWRLGRRAEWRRVVGLLIPHGLSLALVGATFVWQFRGTIPSNHPHSRPFMYTGWPGAPGPVGRFLASAVTGFADGVLPHPLGLMLLGMLLVPWLGGLDGRAGRAARRVSLAALLAVGLQAAAALLGFLPLGGRPRHTAMIVPVVATAVAVALAGWLGRIPRRGWRMAAGVVLAVLVAAGSLRRLTEERAALDRYARLAVAGQVPEYASRPGPLVTDARGRSLASWWLVPARAPRLASVEGDGCERFDYQGVEVTQCQPLLALARRAVDLARRGGRSWVVVTGQDDPARRALMRELLARFPEVAVRWGEPVPELFGLAVGEVEPR